MSSHGKQPNGTASPNASKAADHVARNRKAWDGFAPEYVEPGRESWASEDPFWGIWRVSEAEVGFLPENLEGLDTLELGCGAGYVSAWLARRGARPVGLDLSTKQLASAAAFQREFDLRFPLMRPTQRTSPSDQNRSISSSASTVQASGAIRTGGSRKRLGCFVQVES